MSKRSWLLACLIFGLALLGSCGAQATTAPWPEKPAAPPTALDLRSTAFAHGQPIPVQYSCAGQNVSPPLAWSDPPAGTQSFVLIADDPDAPGGTWTHWVLFNLPAVGRSLPENVPPEPQRPDGSRHGQNSWGKTGYGGPCPPSGTHRYFFRLYALDTMLDLPPGATPAHLQQAMQGHTLGQGEVMGTFTRP